MYLSLIFAVLVFSCIMIFIEDYTEKWNATIYTAIGMCLILLAAFRPAGMDNDYDTYVSNFMNHDSPKLELTIEWSFRQISKILYTLTKDYHSLFLFFAIIGVTTKLIAIRQLSASLFLPLSIYIGNFYILHDFTQIRAGAASGFFLLGLVQLCREERLKAFAFFCISIFFHYSAIVLTPLLLLSNKRDTIKARILWASIIPLAYVVYIAKISISSLPIPYAEEKFATYEALSTIGFIDEANVFNLLLLTKIIVFYYLLAFYDTICNHVTYFPIILKIWALSIFSFVAFTSMPVIAFRISELLGIVEIFTFPCIFYTIKPLWVPKNSIAILSVGLLCLQAFANKILKIM